MRQVFLDASFYIALIDPRDALHARAREVIDLLVKEGVRFATVDIIVYEILAFFSNEGEFLRARGCEGSSRDPYGTDARLRSG